MTGRKIEAHVVEAIRNLQVAQGSTSREICRYISQEYDVPVFNIRRQVQLALKRGITYGILQRLKGGCYTYKQEFLPGLPLSAGDARLEVSSFKRGRRRRRRSSGRDCRGRGKSLCRSRRRSRQRSRRKSRRRAEVSKEMDDLELKPLTKQAKRSNSLLRKENSQRGVSPFYEYSDEKRE